MKQWKRHLGGWLACWAGGLGLAPMASDATTHDEDLVVYLDRADMAAQLPPYEVSGVVPMVRLQFHYGHRPKRQGTTFHTARPDFEIARDALRQFDALPDGAPVGLFLHGVGDAESIMGPELEPVLHPEGRSPEALARGGFVDFTQDMVRRVMQRLNVEHIQPDFVILDYETGWRKGALGRRDGEVNPVAYREDVEKLWQLARDVLPEALREAGPEFMLPYPSVEATMVFHAWSLRRRGDALAAAVYEPVDAAFGRKVAASNYLDQVRAWTTTDLNGWPQPVVEKISASWSSPQAYLADMRGKRYHGMSVPSGLAKVWADQRDEIRAALSWSPNVAPWYSRPDYGCPEGTDVEAWRWAWAAGLLHDRTHGVRRMLFFSAGGWSQDELAFAGRVFTALQAMPAEATAYRPNIKPVPVEEADAWLAGWVERTKRLIDDQAAEP